VATSARTGRTNVTSSGSTRRHLTSRLRSPWFRRSTSRLPSANPPGTGRRVARRGWRSPWWARARRRELGVYNMAMDKQYRECIATKSGLRKPSPPPAPHSACARHDTHTYTHTHTHTHTYTHITTRMYTYVYARGPRANHNNVLHARMGPARRQQLVNELSVTLRCKHKKELSTWQPVMIWTRSYR
jgi:hypothetical protein